MKVKIWSDVVCPFCYIGKRRFEQALQQFPAKDRVEIVWRSYQLDPEGQPVPGQSVYEYLAQRKGVSVSESKGMHDHMAAMAKEVGLDYNFDQAVVSNTLKAHQLIHLAQKSQKQDAMKERLFAAYYTQGQDIGDLDTLVRLGVEVGLDETEIREALQSDAYRAAVLEDIQQAQRVGVRGVPFFVFNQKYAVSGAQPADLFQEVLEKVWEEEKPSVIEETSGGACTPDGVCA